LINFVASGNAEAFRAHAIVEAGLDAEGNCYDKVKKSN
jgi:hypothetical protein